MTTAPPTTYQIPASLGLPVAYRLHAPKDIVPLLYVEPDVALLWPAASLAVEISP